MTGGMQGADVAALRRLAHQLDARVNDLRQLGARLTTQIMSSGSWRGGDAERFRSEWSSQHRPRLDRAADAVQLASRALAKNADEQEHASAGSGRTTGHGGDAARKKATGPPIDEGATSDGSLGTLDPKVKEEWAKMSAEDRRKVLDELVEEQAKRNGVDVPKIDWTLDDGYGEWDPGDHTMRINPDYMDNPEAMLDTIVHEMRHAGQQEWVDQSNSLGGIITRPWVELGLIEDPYAKYGLDIHDVDKFAENDDDYYSGDDYTKYLNQPVEYDAWTTAGDYIDHLTPEEFERLRREAG